MKENSLVKILENKDSVIYKMQCEITNLRQKIEEIEGNQCKIIQKDKEIEDLNEIINNLKIKLEAEQDKTGFSDIQTTLKVYEKNKKITGLFEHIQKNTYSCSNMIVNLGLKNHMLYVTHQDSEIQIDDFVNENFMSKSPITSSTPSKTHLTEEVDVADGFLSSSSFSSEKTQSKTSLKRLTKLPLKFSNLVKSDYTIKEKIMAKRSPLNQRKTSLK